ncbi:MAG: hypothetical protein GXX79_00125 [Actinomycetales bacterium]|nr:hypothetical protein [Actinomycetales bacterium]
MVGDPRVAHGWADASVLAGLTVGALASHTARSVLQVENFLDAGEPQAAGDDGTQDPVDAGGYFAGVAGLDDPGSAVNTGVRDRAALMAADGPQSLVADMAGCLRRLTARLPDEPAGRRVTAFGGQPMALDEYLRTRLVEFCVHADDLALSIGAGPSALPEVALRVAVDVLVGTAVTRHGAPAVLRALARRERDAVAALRVL